VVSIDELIDERNKISYDDIVENLAALLAEFYPEGQGARRRGR
jgi:hypothetical protein